MRVGRVVALGSALGFGLLIFAGVAAAEPIPGHRGPVIWCGGVVFNNPSGDPDKLYDYGTHPDLFALVYLDADTNGDRFYEAGYVYCVEQLLPPFSLGLPP